jgi:L,D-peptidoglycan transpeptidase YkuD (ErfK/YbiS/YcfS/YnhG family)
MRKIIAVIVAVLGMTMFSALPASAVTNTKIPEASRYQPSSTTLQALVVKSTSWSTTYATITSWERTSASAAWTKRVAGPGRVGYNGTSYYRKQGSGKTPAGKFGIGKALVPTLRTDTKLSQRVYTSSTYWVYDPQDQKSYNFIKEGHPSTALWRTSEAEHLVDYKSQYSPAIVIKFNLPWKDSLGVWHYADVTRGGGIFLHNNGSGATAGCVSVPYDRMQAITRWLNPAKNPIIIIGEDDWLKGVGTTR